MIDPTSVTSSALGLIFLLGLRHGLDPDHIAVIDNLTFRAAEERPLLAPWTGTFFAVGHSISVAIVALAVSWLAGRFAWPEWIGAGVDILIFALLVLVGTLNLRALLGKTDYTPVGWRHKFLPRNLVASSHPAAVIAIGMIFGLVFDTATQAAAWGTIAATGGGATTAAIIAGTFAIGMIVTDTIDSQIVARLLRVGGDPAKVRGYRRAVGWTIVGMSYGMAGYALVTLLAPSTELADGAFTAMGVAMATTVIALLWMNRLRRRQMPS
ncbi:nickel permease [Erythrobacter sp. QSSC1-22B]|uniref:HoxN/HupN/NixA family nickel/cobalt transporter n=1 Tax=Erythrobacter sp. QSSC1-22B TaxID=1860125 RepID=UPI00080566D9|nr:nickel permease [Erythrobacter sp. QSSC1-22B]OBX17875.1 nickel permease [Erythrobacter sp. QSSC1-22B]